MKKSRRPGIHGKILGKEPSPFQELTEVAWNQYQELRRSVQDEQQDGAQNNEWDAGMRSKPNFINPKEPEPWQEEQPAGKNEQCDGGFRPCQVLRPTPVPKEIALRKHQCRSPETDTCHQMDGAVEPRSHIQDDGWRGGFPSYFAVCAKSRPVQGTIPGVNAWICKGSLSSAT